MNIHKFLRCDLLLRVFRAPCEKREHRAKNVQETSLKTNQKKRSMRDGDNCIKNITLGAQSAPKIDPGSLLFVSAGPLSTPKAQMSTKPRRRRAQERPRHARRHPKSAKEQFFNDFGTQEVVSDSAPRLPPLPGPSPLCSAIIKKSFNRDKSRFPLSCWESLFNVFL